MAYCLVVDNRKGNAEVYEQIVRKLAENGDMPPEGAIFQVAGPTQDGWRVVSVWQSREAQERFRDERLLPAFKEFDISRDDLSWSDFDAHSFMAGDLSGASQPG